VRFDDDALAPAVHALRVTADQPREALAEMHYAVTGRGAYAVLEEGDRVATGLAAEQAIGTVADRIRRRVLDHLSLGGWTAARAGIARVDRGRVLVLGDDDRAFTSRLRREGHEVEGDDLVFFRGEEVVSLPQPSSSDVQLGRPTAVVVVRHGSGDPTCTPVASGEVVEALLAATVPSWAPPGRVLRACVDLAGNVDGYRVER